MVYWGLVCGDSDKGNPHSCPYQKEDNQVADRDTWEGVGRTPKMCVPVSQVFLRLDFQGERRQVWTPGWSLQWPQWAPCSPAPLGRFSILLFWSQGKAGPASLQVAFILSRLGREKSADGDPGPSAPVSGQAGIREFTLALNFSLSIWSHSQSLSQWLHGYSPYNYL